MKVIHKVEFKTGLHFYIFTQLNDLFHWGISPGDLRLLAELYNADYEMLSTGKVKEYKDRMSILFSSDFKQDLMKKLSMSYNSYHNSIAKLKKKELISKNNTINEKMLFNLKKDIFSLIIECQNEKGNTGTS